MGEEKVDRFEVELAAETQKYILYLQLRGSPYYAQELPFLPKGHMKTLVLRRAEGANGVRGVSGNIFRGLLKLDKPTEIFSLTLAGFDFLKPFATTKATEGKPISYIFSRAWEKADAETLGVLIESQI